jgi:hypothetical protein
LGLFSNSSGLLQENERLFVLTLPMQEPAKIAEDFSQLFVIQSWLSICCAFLDDQCLFGARHRPSQAGKKAKAQRSDNCHSYCV